MREIILVIRAEIMKQHRNWFHSTSVYFSLLIWPVLVLLNIYYTYKPFDITNKHLLGYIDSNQKLMLFLVTGYMGYICFWSMVQSAWQMGFERQNGTIETIFLSPANRLAIMYGRSLGSLFENTWMFSVFSIFMIIINKSVSKEKILLLPIIFLVLIISAAVWGGLMNVLFLFSRDAYILFDIFDEPMNLFSGVRIPVEVFPLWAKFISAIFPLTYTLLLIRNLFMDANISSSVIVLIKLAFVTILIIVITAYLLKAAEKNAKLTGNYSLY